MTTKTIFSTCVGSGLKPEVLASKINGLNIAQFDRLELTALRKALQRIDDALGKKIAEQMIPSIEQLIELGLGYISLSRKMGTLSGGEAQRVKIARHLGSSLNNLIYIFDEPSAGLHPEEVPMLIQLIQRLKHQRNTVIVVEHDPSIIAIADEVIEMGPGAGSNGGQVIYQGIPAGLQHSLAQTRINNDVNIKEQVRKSTSFFTLEDVKQHNLKNITVNIPKHVLVSVCGVSGAGKSTLILDVFLEKYPDAIWVSQDRIGISS